MPQSERRDSNSRQLIRITENIAKYYPHTLLGTGSSFSIYLFCQLSRRNSKMKGKAPLDFLNKKPCKFVQLKDLILFQCFTFSDEYRLKIKACIAIWGAFYLVGHPGSGRNRERVYLKERLVEEQAKADERARLQFQTEMEAFANASMLSHEEREKFRQRQSVSWLYQRPPGFMPSTDDVGAHGDTQGNSTFRNEEKVPMSSKEVTDEKDSKFQKSKETVEKGKMLKSGNYVSTVLNGFQALHRLQQDNFEIKSHAKPHSRSPPRGGFDVTDKNQQFIVSTMDSEEEEEIFRKAMFPEEEHSQPEKEARRKERRERRKAQKKRVEEAKAFLKAIGVHPKKLECNDIETKVRSRDESPYEHESKKRRRRSNGICP